MEKQQVSSKSLLVFLEGITKLDPVKFVGLTKILCVPIVDEKYEERKFEDILSDLIDNFIEMPKKRRREILGIIKEANKKNGITT